MVVSLGLLTVSARAQKAAYCWENLPVITRPSFKADTFNIISYGAKADGITLNTESINKAIEACNQNGGGVVLVPQGIWQTGPIQLKSNVNLHVSQMAILQFTADKSQYQLELGNYEGKKAVRNQSPISGVNLENIAITGHGIIDGHGEVWRAMGKGAVTERKWSQLTKTGVVSENGKTWYPSKSYALGAQDEAARTYVEGKNLEEYRAVKDYFRPNLLVLNGCKKVLLENVTFQNSPAWCLHTLMCENLSFDGVKVRNEENAQNGDGFDIESCQYVSVENCVLDCGDDGITIKSGKDAEGRARGVASAYMVIKNNVVYKAHGGFVIGSEMSGGAHDIFVSDCNFIGTATGLRFKTVRGRGGVVENIHIRNIGMRDIVSDAITFDMYYFTKKQPLGADGNEPAAPSVDEGTPQFRNFYIDNIICDGAGRAMLFRGLPEMHIKGIHVSNARMVAEEGPEIVEASDITLDNVELHIKGKKTNGLMHIENSHDVHISDLSAAYAHGPLFTIDGKRAKNITLKGAGALKGHVQSQFRMGATKAALSVVD